jgi:hypothetical protein
VGTGMTMDDFWVALCLMLVFEGMMPFLYPNRFRKMVVVMAQMDDNRLRVIGLISMVLGVVSLYWIN